MKKRNYTTKVIAFLNKNPGYWAVRDIHNKTRINVKTIYSALKRLMEEGTVESVKEDDSHILKYRAMLHRYRPEQPLALEAFKEENLVTQELLPTPKLQAGSSDLLTRIANMERQNQMYHQALGQIASILEQCGYLEGV